MSSTATQPLAGHCTCGEVRYQLTAAPMFVHCCHCSWCQRETGSAFAINALIESDCLDLLAGVPTRIELPSASGRGQSVYRCPKCEVALWSHYAGAGDAMAFVRVGTLEEPGRVEPDVHIYASDRLAWVRIPEGAKAFEEYYSPKQEWPPESQKRYLALKKS